MSSAGPRPTNKHEPDSDRLSVLTAVILLAYVTERVFALPVWKTQFVLLGSHFDFQVDIQLVVGILLVGLTATGANWLFHDHPDLQGKNLSAHLLLPTLSALMIGYMLAQLPYNIFYWLGLMVGMVLVVTVLVAEYISIGQDDSRQPLAAAVLTAAEFALYILLITVLRAGQIRLYQLLPAVFLGTGLVSLRNYHLRLQGEWLIYESGLVAFIVSQLGMALHYLPLTPIAFGLLLLGATYALNSFFVSLIEERPVPQAVVEPLVVIGLTSVAALLVH